VDVVSKVLPTGTRTASEEEVHQLWWIFLVVGVLWLVYALLVFQFDESSVNAISILLGITCLGAALLELLEIPASHGLWRLGRVALAAVFAIIGIVAFVHPGDSFSALGTIFAFYLLVRGIFELIAAFVSGGSAGGRFLTGVVGVAQIGLAFWAAGDFGHKSFLLVVWVGATALAHGVLQIVKAFELRPG
jgi:uncharacterized membrane protein HdeD (DUF308 family)